VGESSLDDALPWDRIAAARFQHYTAAHALPAAVSLDRAEAERNKADPNFQWLVASIAASDKLRAQKSLSLNLTDRKAERERLDAERLQRENQRRSAEAKPVFANVVEMDAADDVSGEKAPDILLDRTLQITADIVTDGSKPPPRTVAKRQDNAATTPAP
jgi:carboxyl-terminal processing protease